MKDEVTRLARDVFNRRAKEYQQKFMDVSLYADSLDFFCDQLKPGAEVLELACGPGNITRYLLNRRPELRILATEIAPAMLELAAAANPGVQLALLDARKISSLRRTFDAILAGFCLPYLSRQEVDKLFLDTAALLKNDGILYISTMEDDHARSGRQTTPGGETLFIYYYEEGDLQESLSLAGFEPVWVRRKFFNVDDNTINTDLVMIARLKK